MLDQLASSFKWLEVLCAAGKEITTVTRFESGNIVLEHATQPHDFQSMSTQCLLVMVSKGDEKK